MEPYALELKNVSRRINSEFSIRDVSLFLKKGETAALVGKNASGKSSLLKVIDGLFPAEQGEIWMDGKPVSFRCPADAKEHHILFLEQNSKGFPGLNVFENVYFGKEIYKKGLKLLDTSAMKENCQKVFDEMGCKIDVCGKLSALTASQLQFVQLASAVLSDAAVILMDEPTARLSPKEKGYFARAIEGLKKRGISFLLVSHDADEVLSLSDRIYVMEGGAISAQAETQNADLNWLAEQITGRAVADLYHKEPIAPGKVIAELACPKRGLTLSLREGEIVAISGNCDSGAEQLLLAAAGFQEEEWSVTLNGNQIKNPVDALRAGASLGYSPDWTAKMKLYEQAGQTAKSSKAAARKASFLEVMQLTGESLRNVVALGGSIQEEYSTGGNLQREMVEKALRRQASLYLLNCPSAGVDIPSRLGLYSQMVELSKKGSALIICTYQPDEAAGIADRVILLKDGVYWKTIPGGPENREKIRQAIQSVSQ